MHAKDGGYEGRTNVQTLAGYMGNVGVHTLGARWKGFQRSGSVQKICRKTRAASTWIEVLGRLVDFFHRSSSCGPGDKVNEHNQARAGEDLTGG